MQKRTGKKTLGTYSYHVNQVKVWIYLVFAVVMDAFCVFATVYGNGSANGLAAMLILFFTAAALVPLYLIYRRRVHRPELRISAKGVSVPKVFRGDVVKIPFRHVRFMREVRIPAVVEIHYEEEGGKARRQLVWADMFRNKEEYARAAGQLMKQWERLEKRRGELG